MTALIFAYWTLNSSDHYFDAYGEENRDSYLIQPHIGQVISIFRLFSIADDSVDLVSSAIEIGTGEGKSVTLAVSACIFALLGYEVDIACYS